MSNSKLDFSTINALHDSLQKKTPEEITAALMGKNGDGSIDLDWVIGQAYNKSQAAKNYAPLRLIVGQFQDSEEGKAAFNEMLEDVKKIYPKTYEKLADVMADAFRPIFSADVLIAGAMAGIQKDLEHYKTLDPAQQARMRVAKLAANGVRTHYTS